MVTSRAMAPGTAGEPAVEVVELGPAISQLGSRRTASSVTRPVSVGAKPTIGPVIRSSFTPRIPWTDRWASSGVPAQNVFAVAAHTLALFERHLGRPIPGSQGWPHLYLLPEAKLEGNANYSRTHAGVLFGWLPKVEEPPSVYTSLSYGVIAHQVSHAILDGVRPRYIEPGLPYQRRIS